MMRLFGSVTRKENVVSPQQIVQFRRIVIAALAVVAAAAVALAVPAVTGAATPSPAVLGFTWKDGIASDG